MPRLKTHIMSHSVICADETTWRVMGKGSSKRWYAWAVATEDAVDYEIAPSRSAETALGVIGDYDGIVLTDGYQAYQSGRDGPGRYRLAHCWAHVRRKFIEAEAVDPRAAEAVAMIGELYAVERDIKGAADDEVLRAREQRSRAILKRLFTWAGVQPALPNSPLRKAIEYMAKLWAGLELFVTEPALSVDNNGVERALRGLVLGRKNHHGSRSKRGTEVAALFYSLIESAKLAGVDPAEYLRAAAHAAVSGDAAPLPHELKG